jgi:hypothetical protein
MKPSVTIDKEKITQLRTRFNETREPDNDWQNLLKGVVAQIMDDYVRLQHPTRRTAHYLKEAFLSSVAALWDDDYEFDLFLDEDAKPLTFRGVLAARFGIENLSVDEIHKINLGLIQEECIREAKEYWLDKCLQVVDLPDFFIFDGRAFSIYKTDDESKVDYDEMIIYLEDGLDVREKNETFIRLTMDIAAYYRDIKVKDEVLDALSKAWYEILRLNSCFRGD